MGPGPFVRFRYPSPFSSGTGLPFDRPCKPDVAEEVEQKPRVRQQAPPVM